MSLAERLVALVLLAGGVLLALLGGRLPLPALVGLWAGLLGSGVVVARPIWARWFGPVFFFDLVRTSRRGRYFALRCGYVAALLVVLFFYYSRWFPGLDLEDLFVATSLSPSSAARFADGFFTTFLQVQFLAALGLAPLFTAGAITEEKERRTLDYLLTTDLHAREIVLGKLGSRLGQLGLLVITGVPVLSILQFMGGVDPELVLGGALATLFTVLSAASLGVAVSVGSATTGNAVFRTYLCIGLYLFFTGCLGCCTFEVPLLNFGNPLLAYIQLQAALDSSPTRVTIFSLLGGSGLSAQADALIQILIGYCLSHVVLAVFSMLLAVRNLRGPVLERFRRKPPVAAALPPPVADEPRLPRPIYRRRPPLRDNALWWKELHDSAIHLSDARADLMGCFLLFTFLAGAFFAIVLLADVLRGGDGSMAWPTPHFFEGLEALNLVVRALGTALATFMFVLIAVNAAGRLSRELEKQTLESLLVLPIERGEILVAKWWASVLHVRGLWWFLAWFWLIAFLSGGPTFLGLPFVIAWWWVYAGFVAALGMWFSVLTRSTLRATLWTPLGVMAVSAGAWVALEGVIQYLIKEGSYPRLTAALGQFQDYGLAPFMSLWVLSSSYAELERHVYSGHFLAAVAGMGFYLSLTALLWAMTRSRFRSLIGEAPEKPPRGGGTEEKKAVKVTETG